MSTPFWRCPCDDEPNIRPPLVRLRSLVHGVSRRAWGVQFTAQTSCVQPCRRTMLATIPKDTPQRSKTSNRRMSTSRSAPGVCYPSINGGCLYGDHDARPASM